MRLQSAGWRRRQTVRRWSRATKELRDFMKTPQSESSRQALAEIGYEHDLNEVGITQFATDLVLGKVDAGDALRVLDPKVSGVCLCEGARFARVARDGRQYD